MEEVQPRSGQIIELQSLRGIAALTVAMGHALTYYYATSSYGSMVLNGRGAVVVFFVLSGYVLTRSLRSTHFDRHSVLYFYGQRAVSHISGHVGRQHTRPFVSRRAALANSFG